MPSASLPMTCRSSVRPFWKATWNSLQPTQQQRNNGRKFLESRGCLKLKAEIIAVGSELLTPDRLDTNSLFLTEELNKIGIEVVRKTVVGDHRDTLRAAFHEALQRV